MLCYFFMIFITLPKCPGYSVSLSIKILLFLTLKYYWVPKIWFVFFFFFFCKQVFLGIGNLLKQLNSLQFRINVDLAIWIRDTSVHHKIYYVEEPTPYPRPTSYLCPNLFLTLQSPAQSHLLRKVFPGGFCCLPPSLYQWNL